MGSRPRLQQRWRSRHNDPADTKVLVYGRQNRHGLRLWEVSWGSMTEGGSRTFFGHDNAIVFAQRVAKKPVEDQSGYAIMHGAFEQMGLLP